MVSSVMTMIAMAMKISNNLERVGDEAAKIAKRARDRRRLSALVASG